MKISGNKRSFWVYFGLIAMVIALILFSILPLVTSMMKEQNRLSSSSSGGNLRREQEAMGYQLVIEREPDNQNALRGLLNIRLKQGDIGGAIEPLSRLAQLNPEVTDYQLLLAQTQAQIEDYRGATATYRRAIEQDPSNMLVIQSWTEMLMGQNRFEEAISVVKQAILSKDTRVDSTALQLRLGEIYTAQGQPQQAITLYEQLIKTASKDFRPILAKALLLKQQGNVTDAEPLFNTAIELAPVAYKDQIKALATISLRPKSNPSIVRRSAK